MRSHRMLLVQPAWRCLSNGPSALQPWCLQKGPMEERFDSNGNLFLGLGECVVAGLKQGRDKNLPVYYRRLNIAKSKERTG